jgi:hypothetical protein
MKKVSIISDVGKKVALNGLVFITYMFILSFFDVSYKYFIYIYLVPYIISIFFHYDYSYKKSNAWLNFDPMESIWYLDSYKKEKLFGAEYNSELYNLKDSKHYRFVVQATNIIKIIVHWFVFIGSIFGLFYLIITTPKVLLIIIPIILIICFKFLYTLKVQEIKLKEKETKNELKKSLN